MVILRLRCPFCLAESQFTVTDAVSAKPIEGPQRLEPGNWFLCTKCAHLSVVDEERRLKWPTLAHWRTLPIKALENMNHWQARLNVRRREVIRRILARGQ